MLYGRLIVFRSGPVPPTPRVALYVTRVLRTPAGAAVGVRILRGGCVQGASPLATLCRPSGTLELAGRIRPVYV